MLTSALSPSPDVQERVDRLEIPWNAYGFDPYGVDKAQLGRFFTWLDWFYRSYFDVNVYGAELVPKRGRAMLVGNHQGGVAIDGAMVVASTFFELDPPRLAQGMAEKFLMKLPGAAYFTSKVGHFAGLPEHARRLLEDERLLMVFPEGARGTAKLARDSDTLVRFGTGFMRLALRTGSPIVPVGFVGGGEAFPTVMNLYRLGKLLGVPYVPITRYLLPVPRPATFQLMYSAPMIFEGDGSESDTVIRGYVDQVRTRIAWLIEQGREIHEGRMSPDDLELT